MREDTGTGIGTGGIEAKGVLIPGILVVLFDEAGAILVFIKPMDVSVSKREDVLVLFNMGFARELFTMLELILLMALKLVGLLGNTRGLLKALFN